MLACRPINFTNFGFNKRNHSPDLLRCGDVAWEWFMEAQPQCLKAALAQNISHCCIGWSDALFLPQQSHARFRELVRAFQGVFHEVAIPTILNAIAAGGGARWAPSLPCLGSCCSTSPRRSCRRSASPATSSRRNIEARPAKAWPVRTDCHCRAEMLRIP